MSALSRERFVEQVLERVAAKFPLVRIARGRDPFSMLVNGNVASLENLYRSVVLWPEDSQRQIERWIVELLRAAEGSPDRGGSFEQLKDRIMPMILSERDAAAHRTNMTQPLIDGLFVAYVIDSDRSIAYIPQSQFESWNITAEELHEAALDNLVSRSESMSAHAAQDESGSVNLILFQTMDGYDASRVLLPTLHDRLREYLGSPFAAGIPNRNILLCFRNDETTVDHLREQIAEDHRRLPHGVTERLVLVTPDGIAPMD